MNDDVAVAVKATKPVSVTFKGYGLKPKNVTVKRNGHRYRNRTTK
jgi:hypothetical protein